MHAYCQNYIWMYRYIRHWRQKKQITSLMCKISKEGNQTFDLKKLFVKKRLKRLKRIIIRFESKSSKSMSFWKHTKRTSWLMKWLKQIWLGLDIEIKQLLELALIQLKEQFWREYRDLICETKINCGRFPIWATWFTW